jgi:hypothetical protein
MKKAYRAPGLREYGTVSEFTLGFTGTVPDFSPTYGFVGPGCETQTFLDPSGNVQNRTVCILSP